MSSARQAYMRAGWIGVAVAAPILGAPFIVDLVSDGKFDRRLLANVVLMPIFLASVFGFVGFVGWFRHLAKQRTARADSSVSTADTGSTPPGFTGDPRSAVERVS